MQVVYGSLSALFRFSMNFHIDERANLYFEAIIRHLSLIYFNILIQFNFFRFLSFFLINKLDGVEREGNIEKKNLA